MMANVVIKIGDGGTEIPKKVIEILDTLMSAGTVSANITMAVDGVRYTVAYSEVPEVKE